MWYQWHQHAILNEGLESLLVFTLEHHLQLLSSGLFVISFFSINVQGLQVIYGSGMEDFPVLQLLGVLMLNFGASQQEVVLWDDAIVIGTRAMGFG